jgi:hypothetical protein
MLYGKPEIVDMRQAFKAVRGVQKGTPFHPDSMKIETTPSAYEADE